MNRPRIAITGMGMVSALGWSADDAWSAMEAERSGLQPLGLFASPRCGHVLVGEVRGDCARRSGLRGGSRSDRLAVFAARSAFEQAGLASLTEDGRGETGVVLGACTGGMLDTECFVEDYVKGRKLDARLLRHHECASSANAIARELGLGGFRATVSTACSSGAMAVAVACDALADGEARVMLAGGADSLTRLTLNGFCSLLNVDPGGCRPFDANRNGMSLGEGAGMLVLETEESARARGARVLAFIGGYGSTCDAHHTTAPAPDGLGVFNAMRLALESAGMAPADVDYINAHGTGTRENDAAEGAAIARMFGADPPPVSSTKRFFGHTLAAAGAIEIIVCALALMNQKVPGNLGMATPDASLGFTPVQRMAPASLRVAMSNSLGFGGNNCSVIICRDGGEGWT